MNIEINIMSCIFSAVVTFVLSLVIYHPRFLGKKWAEHSKLDFDNMEVTKSYQKKLMFTSLVSRLALALVINILILNLPIVSLSGVLVYSLLFSAIAVLAGYMNAVYEDGMNLWKVHSVINIVNIVIISIVVYIFK